MLRTDQTSSRQVWWLAVLVLVAGVWIFTACVAPATTEEPQGSEGSPISQRPAAAPLPDTATLSTEPNLKVAFIGDTDNGNDFRRVLRLIREEKAQAVFIQGDLSYGFFDGADDWFPVIDSEINKLWDETAPVTIPYFMSRGNHDMDWYNYASGLKERMAWWNIRAAHNQPADENYVIDFKGLRVVMVSDEEVECKDDEDKECPRRPEYVLERFKNDDHIWRICSWHKNQKETNVGGKRDGMGWEIYENCRAAGAIVAQGHSHSYSRSKTITHDKRQTVDPTCSDPNELCVKPGKHFFFDSSLGGRDMRSLTEIASRPHWGSTFSSDYGALFIEFHVDGDPKKARGYFKTVGGVVIDPPPSSGKTHFTITR